MHEDLKINLNSNDRLRLEAIVSDPKSRPKSVKRAMVILASAEGLGTPEIARRAGVSVPSVRRWQERFMREGLAGLLQDKTRKPGIEPLPASVVDRVIELTLAGPPGAATYWTGRAMAAAAGISLRSVQRIWQAHRLDPRRIRTIKRYSTRLVLDTKQQEAISDQTYMRNLLILVSTSWSNYDNEKKISRDPALLLWKDSDISVKKSKWRLWSTRSDLKDSQALFTSFEKFEQTIPSNQVVYGIISDWAHRSRDILEWLSCHSRWTFYFVPGLPLPIESSEDSPDRADYRSRSARGDHVNDEVMTVINAYIGEYNTTQEES